MLENNYTKMTINIYIIYNFMRYITSMNVCFIFTEIVHVNK